MTNTRNFAYTSTDNKVHHFAPYIGLTKRDFDEHICDMNGDFLTASSVFIAVAKDNKVFVCNTIDNSVSEYEFDPEVVD